MTSPTPDASVTIDGGAPRDDVVTASAPDILAPGMPPGGGANDPSPNIVYTSRSRRRQQAADAEQASGQQDTSGSDSDAPKRATAKSRSKKSSGSSESSS